MNSILINMPIIMSAGLLVVAAVLIYRHDIKKSSVKLKRQRHTL